MPPSFLQRLLLEGYTKISIEDGLSYLVVPEGAAVPSGVPAEITVIQQPLVIFIWRLTSAMDLFRRWSHRQGYPVRRGGGRMVYSGGQRGNGAGEDGVCRKIPGSRL